MRDSTGEGQEKHEEEVGRRGVVTTAEPKSQLLHKLLQAKQGKGMYLKWLLSCDAKRMQQIYNFATTKL